MRFEVLKRSNVKRNIMIGVVVVAIIVVCVVTLTRAKYRSVASTTLIKGEVNFTLADLNIVAITLDGYAVDALSIDGAYKLLESSYCEVDNTRIDTLSWDIATQTLTIEPFTTRGTKCYLDFETVLYLREAILADNEVPQTSQDLLTTSCEKESNNGNDCGIDENGLYQETVYEGTADEGTTYYFRGTVDNNWVEFADFYWRIIRINEDGTIRLIYNGKSTTSTQEAASIGSSYFNNDYTGAYSVGYTYEAGYQRPTNSENEEDSTIKGVIDEWYKAYLLDTDYEDYLADSGFCNDRNLASSYTWGGTSGRYAAYDRISGTPTFECTKEDLYTVDSDKGNGALDYAIGLITMDEVRYAGAYSTTTNRGFWLYTTGSHPTYHTMSPSSYSSSGTFMVTLSYGAFGSSRGTLQVRPVINLSADVTISEGDGTAENPYIVNNS